MKKILKLLKMANKIDKEDPILSDKFEKKAQTYIDTYLPQSSLEQVYKNVGRGGLSGDLGGFHTRMEIQGGAKYSPQAINDAMGLISELGYNLPTFEQWQKQHPNLTANPQEVYNILEVLQPFYLAEIKDPAQLQNILNTSGPIDLQYASSQLPSSFSYYGITPQEVMEHETGHRKGISSSRAEYENLINQNLSKNSVGGNINPRYTPSSYIPYQFMESVTGPEEYGPSKHILQRLLRENRG
jgi:hypothetical protein